MGVAQSRFAKQNWGPSRGEDHLPIINYFRNSVTSSLVEPGQTSFLLVLADFGLNIK